MMIIIVRATKSRCVAMYPVLLRHQTCVGYGDDNCWKGANRWQFYVKMDLKDVDGEDGTWWRCQQK